MTAAGTLGQSTRAGEQDGATKNTRTATLIDQFLKQDFLRLPAAEFDIPPMPVDFFKNLEEIHKRMRVFILLPQHSPPAEEQGF